MKKKTLIKNTRQLDQFYTKPNVTDYLIKKSKRLNFLKNNSIVLESSAGSGSFIDSINKVFKSKIKIEAFDIEPKNNKLIKKGDYLKKQIAFNKNRIIIEIKYSSKSNSAMWNSNLPKSKGVNLFGFKPYIWKAFDASKTFLISNNKSIVKKSNREDSEKNFIEKIKEFC